MKIATLIRIGQWLAMLSAVHCGLVFAGSPESFPFISRENIAPGTVVTSDAVPIVGSDATYLISVTGGEYSIGCNGVFSSQAGSIAAGQKACVRLTAPSGFVAQAQVSLKVGDSNNAFTVITAPAPGTVQRRTIRPVYLVPADRALRADYQAAIGDAIDTIIRFYADRLGGYAMQRDAVVVCQSTLPAAYFYDKALEQRI